MGWLWSILLLVGLHCAAGAGELADEADFLAAAEEAAEDGGDGGEAAEVPAGDEEAWYVWLLGQSQLEAERRALRDRRQWEDPESALNNDSEVQESRQERRALLQVQVVVPHLEELVACLRSSAGSSTGRGGGVRRGADGRFTSATPPGTPMPGTPTPGTPLPFGLGPPSKPPPKVRCGECPACCERLAFRMKRQPCVTWGQAGKAKDEAKSKKEKKEKKDAKSKDKDKDKRKRERKPPQAEAPDFSPLGDKHPWDDDTDSDGKPSKRMVPSGVPVLADE